MAGYREQVGYLEALAGLITAPGATTEQLLAEKNPPHSVALLATLIGTIFGPIILHMYNYRYVIYRPEALFSLLFIFSFTLLIFILIESLFLMIIGISIRIEHVMACIMYSLAPLILFFWLVYIFNYLNNGMLSLVSFILYNNIPLSDRFIKIFPLAVTIVQINTILVFFYGIRFLGEMHTITALSVTMLSLIPLYLSFIISLFIADMASPGILNTFLQLLVSPEHLIYFRR